MYLYIEYGLYNKISDFCCRFLIVCSYSSKFYWKLIECEEKIQMKKYIFSQ